MSVIVKHKDIDPVAWDDLVNHSSVATWFQTREAYLFFDSLPFLNAFVYGVEDNGQLKGLIVGYLQKDGGKLKQFLSRRAIIIGGPLLSEDIQEDALCGLLNALKSDLKHKAIYIETRNFNDYGRWCNVFERCGFFREPHYDIWVDTTSMDVVEARLGKSRKRDIRVSQREGATMVVSPSIEQVREFYVILKDLYRKKVKVPLFPLVFFELLYQQPSSKFLLVEYEGRIVGGTVCVGLKDKALYEMYVCGQDGEFKNIFPSELSTYAALQYATELGCPCFDMMGAGKPDDGGYGVRDFKLKFGGELVELGRFLHINNRLLFGIGKFGVKLMKKI